jgi:Ca2+-binding EF-hand superfamily protein
MKSQASKNRSRLAALLLGVATAPALAGEHAGTQESGMSFKDHDADRNGYLTLKEFQARGRDDLAFRAADVDGDERVDPDEFDKYLAKKAADQPKPEPGDAGQPKPAPAPGGY